MPSLPQLHQRSQISVRTMLTAAAVVAAVYLLAKLAFAAAPVLVWIAFALFFAAVLSPIVRWMHSKGLPRVSGVIALVVAFFGLLIGGLLLAAPLVADQARALVDSAPTLLEKARASGPYRFVDARFDVDGLIESGTGALKSAGPSVVSSAAKIVGGVATGLVAMVTVAFLTAFMLLHGPPLVRRGLAEARPTRRVRYLRIIRNSADAMSAYARGLLVLALINAIVTGIVLAALGVPHPIALAVLSGLGSLIPIVGATIAGVLVSAVAFIAAGTWQGVATVGFYLAYQQLESDFIAPWLYGKSLSVNPLVVMLSFVVLTKSGGVVGALAAVPIVAIGQILLREHLAARRERMALPEEGIAGSIGPVLRERAHERPKPPLPESH